MISFFYFTAMAFFLLLAILLCGLIFIQEGKGGGIAAFGGESQDSLFGTSTADILKTITGYMAALFLTLCVMLSLWTSSMGRAQMISDESVIEELQGE